MIHPKQQVKHMLVTTAVPDTLALSSSLALARCSVNTSSEQTFGWLLCQQQVSTFLSEVSEVGWAPTQCVQITVLSEDNLWVSPSCGSLVSVAVMSHRGCQLRNPGATQEETGQPHHLTGAPHRHKARRRLCTSTGTEHLLTRKHVIGNYPEVSADYPGKYQLELQTFLKSLLGTYLCIHGQKLTQRNPAVSHLQMVGFELQKATNTQR